MKKIIIVVAAFFVIISQINAQNFKAGIKVGTNVNKITGKSFKEQFTYGYHAGAFTEIKLSNKFYLQPEVIFNQINADTSSDFKKLYNVTASTVSGIKLNYLSIPILLQLKINKFISINAGPQFGILINQNNSFLQNGKDAFKQGDFSMLGGVQLKFAGIRVYGRYVVGLQNLNDIDNQDKWKNQSIQIGVGLAIL
jgi:Outer membrane protein beta-barrel domain